ncbi:trk system potassium uptake protein TrkH [Tistlia consotensis]|uniref:Trk system potassium uptake protein n=1 Tax=Tistlia consotensis USBA 355 TaxID=560819 RepID=A0A1Y6BD93_9PROT|nr:TrkH family potassium uptake protein [Tistlia consotensis]SMF05340.1 trk system potassium uptake protein TrkH [Tistlia consotensis USBA 355]SNR55258.1 trk system potassium uptake protein TrkH [Tistlia consotensis]
MNPRTLRFVLYVDGLLLLILAAAMTVPMIVDAAESQRDWLTFATSAGVTAYVGGSLAFACRGDRGAIDRRGGYLLTASAWVVVCAFASLPLHFSSLHLSFADAFFETMSGLTTTGSTVITGLDHLPPGLLLWRSLLNWIGGVGIVVMAIVMLPALGVGGMQLFRTESSDISGKPVPRAVEMAGLTVLVYVGLSVACAAAYGVAGMNFFDAVNHAMATIATGGFSTKDASIGYYNSVPIELVSIVFMIAGACPLIWYARLIIHRRQALSEERQVPALLGVLLVAIAAATVWNCATNGMSLGHSLRVSAFNVTSVLTDTGFATSDFAGWGSFAIGLFFLLYLIGGCAGSTSGAIKIFRWQILFVSARRQVRMMLSPHRVLATRYGERAVDDETVQSVRNFFFLYLLTLLILTLVVTATGIDFLSSVSAVAQAMANAGPGLGKMGGPAGNFEAFPDAAKWLLSLAMLLGRLELSTIYVLLLSDYWRG